MMPNLSEVRFSLRYTPPQEEHTRGTVLWVAGNGADPSDPQPYARDRIRHVFLPALRDAVQDLGSRSAAGVRVIIESLLSGTDPVRDTADQPYTREALLDHAGKHFQEIERHPILAKAAERVSQPLRRLTRGAYEQHAGLGFEAASLRSLARDLQLRMADVGLTPREIVESGMGYANLLFIAHVLTQLHAAAEADLTLLLVEEPEAHLHPPLQALLMDYLREAAVTSHQRPPEGRWRGHIQVVVTSHAPSLAAPVDIMDLVVFQRRPAPALSSPAENAAPPAAEAASPTDDIARYQTAMIGIKQLGIDEPAVRKLNRYLDATRSAMLFSPRVMLVEGIAEALIILAAAKVLFPPSSAELDLFLGTVLVPIDGVDFVPYVRVLLTRAGDARIGHRVAILTDGDRQNPQQTGEKRIENLNALIATLGASDHARVFSPDTTLEPELLAAGNDNAIWTAWRRQQPQAWQTAKTAVEDAATGLTRSTVFADRMKSADLVKGDFAQDFLEAADAEWHVPPYMAEALQWLAAEPIQ